MFKDVKEYGSEIKEIAKNAIKDRKNIRKGKIANLTLGEGETKDLSDDTGKAKIIKFKNNNLTGKK